jgi:predicted nucleic acid-binding protein
LDTSVVLRLVLQDVPEAVQNIISLLENSSSHSLLVEDAVLYETVWVLSGPPYNFTREDVGRALLKVSSLAQLKCNRELLFHVLPLYIKHPKLSFVDICLAAYAELNNSAPLLTLDQALAKTLPTARLLTQDARID